MYESVTPGTEWDRCDPADVEMSSAGLESAAKWLKTHREGNETRLLVVRGGRIVLEVCHGLASTERVHLASACKSVFSCVLAIEVENGTIPSPDLRLMDLYPEAVDLPEEAGPRPGRFVTPKDEEITLRQLIGNTSGYMKPAEQPGRVYNYQTFGMNVLSHALARLHGHWDPADPEGSLRLVPTINRLIRDPIGADWGEYTYNFDLGPKAALNVYGYFDGISASLYDSARLGWLWRRFGRWGDRQVVPEEWMREAVRVNPDIMVNGREQDRLYGYGFWTNQFGLLWPDLPRDSFCAHGAGNHLIWVCPSLDLVVVMSPGIYGQKEDAVSAGLLTGVIEACR